MRWAIKLEFDLWNQNDHSLTKPRADEGRTLQGGTRRGICGVNPRLMGLRGQEASEARMQGSAWNTKQKCVCEVDEARL
jgi:hypothetical protein